MRLFRASKEKKNPFLFTFVSVCVLECRDAPFDSTQDQAALKNIKEAHWNSGKESMDTCYLISGEILKSCLVIILQKSQTKSEITNHHSYLKKKKCIHMGLWNHSFEFPGSPALEVPLRNIYIEACLPPHTVRVPTWNGLTGAPAIPRRWEKSASLGMEMGAPLENPNKEENPASGLQSERGHSAG